MCQPEVSLVTRLTVPVLWVSVHRFTAPQAELYEAVLEVQRACLSLCSAGMSLENIYSTMLTLIGQRLRELGISRSGKENGAFKVLHFPCAHSIFTRMQLIPLETLCRDLGLCGLKQRESVLPSARRWQHIVMHCHRITRPAWAKQNEVWCVQGGKGHKKSSLS